MTEELSIGGQLFSKVLNKALLIPGMTVNREDFLINHLPHYYQRLGDELLSKGPVQAGIDPKELYKIGKATINYHTAIATCISAGLGLPGGIAMAGTVPADLAQYYAQLLIMAQKLAYLYGFPDLKKNSDEMKTVLLLGFLAIMFGQSGSDLAKVVIQNYSKQWGKVILKSGGTKTTIYQAINLCAKLLGFDKLGKKAAANVLHKSIPIIGGIVSGVFTLGTFKPSGNKFNNYFFKEATKFKKETQKQSL
ncbi:MAG: hypothetical protein Q4P84_07425 [Elusimicrobiales bacterium]|nr:hypothetical protein [Elusimicrobiales bacterium]